ncbi:hypothetical protein ACHAXT_005545 [Thalassiosira profunda]
MAALPLLAAFLLSTTAAYHLPPMLRGPRFLASRLSRRGVGIGCSQRRQFSAAIKMGDANAEAAPFTKSTNQHKPSPLAGMPIGPSSPPSSSNNIIIRYMYEGGHIGQGRLCHLHPSDDDAVPASQVMRALREDGVDFDSFYACAYESEQSSGGWLPLEPAPRDRNPWSDENEADGCDMTFAIPPSGDADVSRRIDIKLFRRPKAASRIDAIQSLDQVLLDTEATSSENDTIEHSSDALHAISASVPGGKLSLSNGYFGIGIISPKTSENVGTLWRSAYQLGASIIFTIGGRYKSSSTDTLNVPARIPLIELDDWSSFVEWGAPKAAVWVAVEMGGTPLKEFEHPRNAVYILGSEDNGLPKSVLRGCREVVSLESESYGSYNVAVAGSIVMYDRLMKMRAKKLNEPERKM